MRCLILLNRRAGTIRTEGARSVVESLREQARGAGVEADIRLLSPSGLTNAIKAARDDAATDTIIVGGGDGTISCAAELFADSGKTLGILPLGTMNLFARSLRIPLDIGESLRALIEGERAAVDLCLVNDRSFTHHIALGLHPAILRERESLAYHSRLGKIWASLRAYFTALRRPPRLTVTAKIDGETKRYRTPTLVVSNNAFIEGLGRLPYAEDPQGGRLAVYVAISNRRRDILRLSSAVAIGEWVSNPLFESFLIEEVEIAVRRRKQITVSMDGELVRLPLPLRVRIRKGALTVLKPLQDEPADAQRA